LIATLTTFLDTSFPPFNAPILCLEEETSLVDHASRHNCIVLGSPRSNPATEILISRHFKAQPFDSRLANRAKIPFCFVWPESASPELKSSLAEAFLYQHNEQGAIGVYSRSTDTFLGRADYWPSEWFFSHSIQRGLDCGLVVVINKPFQTTENVKLIILAGVGAIGTIAAAHALMRDFRDLDPVAPNTYALGVVEATYRKTNPAADNRELLGFRWTYLSGGRKTVAPRSSSPRSDQ